MIDIPAILAQLQQHYDAGGQLPCFREDVHRLWEEPATVPPQRKREDGSYAYSAESPKLRYAGIGANRAGCRSRAFRTRSEMPGTIYHHHHPARICSRPI